MRLRALRISHACALLDDASSRVAYCLHACACVGLVWELWLFQVLWGDFPPRFTFPGPTAQISSLYAAVPFLYPPGREPVLNARGP